MSHEVLVLNSDYEPLNVCNTRRAMTLMFLGKVDVLHHDARVVRSVSEVHRVPSVVRLKSHVRRPAPQIKLSRRSILARDNYTCQYCGQKGGDMTVDHVVPRRLGGQNTWDNLVCCCRVCNGRKGGKTLQQLGLSLMRQPHRPGYVPYLGLARSGSVLRNEVWRDYLPAYYHRAGQDGSDRCVAVKAS